MYLNLREFKTVKSLYKAMKSEDITPNKMLANIALETAMRTDDSDLIAETLLDFVNIKHTPHHRLKGKLANMADLPDRIYMIMRENFGDHTALQGQRKFSPASFRPGRTDVAGPAKFKGKKINPRKAGVSKTVRSKDRKSINVIM